MSSNVIAFRKLHVNTTPLLLPNAWDAGSARLFESLGAKAVATTSAGMAWALGHRDGRLLPVDEVIGVVGRITRVVKVPVTVDIEHGYSDDPEAVAKTVMRLVDLGVSGINIEDGRDDPAVLAKKIAAIKSATNNAGADIFVNARCDVFLAQLAEEDKLVDESVARGKRYADAGADGLFLPAIAKPEHIRGVVAAVALPLNAMAIPGLASASELGQLGVRRLSAGSGVAQVLWKQAEGLASEFLGTGRSDGVTGNAMPYGTLQGLFPET